MPWTWVRPADPRVLDGRPLLDVGVGDGQTLQALAPDGFRVGVDASAEVMRAARSSGVRRLAVAEARALSFRDAAFAAVLAGDIFHHLDDASLRTVLSEVARVTARGGRLVAWWYAKISRDDAHGPRFPRRPEDVSSLALACGYESVETLELASSVQPAPETTGIVATR